MTEQNNQLDRKDLKIMALKESLSDALDKVSELRVDVTILNAQLEQARNELAALKAAQPEPESPDVQEKEVEEPFGQE